jgi:REP element-mobilizing transposase RayT
MPRQARIDAPGAVHHIIVRGIERRKIFRSDEDRRGFVDRLEHLTNETGTQCLAWALIPNHVHLLLRSSEVPIASVMQRLLTGYAGSFNRKYRRHGQLFQNRYKSILCQEDKYLKELVRYIHLNPLRARLVESIDDLDVFQWSGHSTLMGKCNHPWQAIENVLTLFGKRKYSAVRAYRSYVEKGIAEGRRVDLTGGGLIRSIGGWDTVRKLRKAGVRLKGDERVLGDSDFVEAMLANANERLAHRTYLRSVGLNFERVVGRVAELLDAEEATVLSRDKTPQSVLARRLLCHFAHNHLGLTTIDIAKRLGINQSVVSRAARLGRDIADEKGYILREEDKKGHG